MHMKHNCNYFISHWLHRIRLFHLFPFSSLSPILCGICVSTGWVPAVWYFLCSVLLDDLRPFLLPVFVPFCVLISIAVPRVTRDIFRLLRYCLACRSRTTRNQGSPFVGVPSSWFLALHHRCACSLSARQCTPWTRALLMHTPLAQPCSVNP